MKYTLSDFNYTLPETLIADRPAPRRSDSRLLVLDRSNQSIEHRSFSDITSYLSPQDTLVLNNTKVIKARLLAKKDTGGQIEIFFLHQLEKDKWEVMMSGTGKIREGFELDWQGTNFKVLKKNQIAESATYEIAVNTTGNFFEYLERNGTVPLPPYIKREVVPDDVSQYQTVFAQHEGAVAAPTAGLHFTSELLKELGEKGVMIETILLHVGYGTFSPVKTECLTEHSMHQEFFEVYPKTAERINSIRKSGGRVVACGTTVLRALESSINTEGEIEAANAMTDIFIYPPKQVQSIDALITNFHLPKSSLLMLVSAFAGVDFIKQAYEEAIKEKYRFYSYGDAMLIL